MKQLKRYFTNSNFESPHEVRVNLPAMPSITQKNSSFFFFFLHVAPLLISSPSLLHLCRRLFSCPIPPLTALTTRTSPCCSLRSGPGAPRLHCCVELMMANAMPKSMMCNLVLPSNTSTIVLFAK